MPEFTEKNFSIERITYIVFFKQTFNYNTENNKRKNDPNILEKLLNDSNVKSAFISFLKDHKKFWPVVEIPNIFVFLKQVTIMVNL